MPEIGVYCNVCFELHNVEHVYALPCGHAYCADVLQRQTRRTDGGSRTICPHCKQHSPPARKHRLFLDLRLSDPSSQITTPSIDDRRAAAQIPDEPRPSLYPVEIHEQAGVAATQVDSLVYESSERDMSNAADKVSRLVEQMSPQPVTPNGEDKLLLLLTALFRFVSRAATYMTHLRRLAHEAIETTDRVQQRLQEATKESENLRTVAATARRDASVELDRVKSELEETTKTLKAEKESHRSKIDSIALFRQKAATRDRKIERLQKELDDLRAEIDKLQSENKQREPFGVAEATFNDAGSSTRNTPGLDRDVDVDLDEQQNDVFVDLDNDDFEADTLPVRELSTATPHLNQSVPPPQRPQFGTNWTLPHLRNMAGPSTGTNLTSDIRRTTKKRKASSDRDGVANASGTGPPPFAIHRDKQGHALGAIALGPRMRLNKRN